MLATGKANSHTRHEIHFTGPSLTNQLGKASFLHQLKSSDEIPAFLQFSEDIAPKADAAMLTTDEGDDSLSTTCMYTEMTLKNAKFAP